MKILFLHPSALTCAKIYLRLEPLGLEIVAASAAKAGHEVRLVDLQIFGHDQFIRELTDFRPDAVGFSLNYLPNVPEVIDLAIKTKSLAPSTFVFVGGHSASFIAHELLGHADGAIDCVVRGEGESVIARLLEMVPDGPIHQVPGVVTPHGSSPCAELVADIDSYPPDRTLLRKRNQYFIGIMDPCASIELTRGCPWDCSFCSAWTFYGRKYRLSDPVAVAERLAAIPEPNVFVVDDVAFIHAEHGMAIAEKIERSGIRKKYHVETRGDVLIKNREVFAYWKKLGMQHMFIGIEAIDEDDLRSFRKRTTTGANLEALEIARNLDLTVSLNIIADPGWGFEQFEAVRKWALEVPEIVHLTVATPYPGTEYWFAEPRPLQSLDYRLFDIQHAVLPTNLPLQEFYQELIKTQGVLNRKHLGIAALRQTFFKTAGLLMQGQTNFAKMLWKFNDLHNPEQRFQDHFCEPRYQLTPPAFSGKKPGKKDLFVHGRDAEQEVKKLFPKGSCLYDKGGQGGI